MARLKAKIRLVTEKKWAVRVGRLNDMQHEPYLMVSSISLCGDAPVLFGTKKKARAACTESFHVPVPVTLTYAARFDHTQRPE